MMEDDDERFRSPFPNQVLVARNPFVEGESILGQLGVSPSVIERNLMEENARPGPYSEELVQSITKAKAVIASFFDRHNQTDPFMQGSMITQYAQWFDENTGRISKLIRKEKMPKPKGFWASLFG